MAIKTTNVINPNIQKTYHIDQQIEIKEEIERKNKKMITHNNIKEYNTISNPYSNYYDNEYYYNPFDERKEFIFNPFEHYDSHKSYLNPFDNPWDESNLNNENDETEKIIDNPILNQFDDKILNEMTLIYNIENEDEIKIFGYKFVINNINNCYIIVNRRRFVLCEYFELNNKQK